MADAYNPLPDLGKLLDAALWGRHDTIGYAERIGHRLGLEADSGPKAAEIALGAALGLTRPCGATLVPAGADCGQPSAGLYSGTCENGHPAGRYLCAGHAKPAKPLWCRTCRAVDGSTVPVTLAPACRCAIAGPGEVIPAACPVHGIPCEECGGIAECKPGCGRG